VILPEIHKVVPGLTSWLVNGVIEAGTTTVLLRDVNVAVEFWGYGAACATTANRNNNMIIRSHILRRQPTGREKHDERKKTLEEKGKEHMKFSIVQYAKIVLDQPSLRGLFVFQSSHDLKILEENAGLHSQVTSCTDIKPADGT
jgi:hypothetical protein